MTWLLTSLLLGCLAEAPPASLSGTVTDARGGGSPVAGAAVTVRDEEAAVFSEATADGSGWFEAPLPTNQVFSVTAAAEGFAPTAFTGFAGTQPLVAEDGQLWLRSEADAAALREEFAGCAAEDGGMIEGEIRLYVLQGQDPDELPLVTTATATAVDSQGNAWQACYLDDEGASAPDGEETGQTGRFGIFGLPAGLYTLELSYDYGGSSDQIDESYLYVPEGGDAPQYPALVSLPGG